MSNQPLCGSVRLAAWMLCAAIAATTPRAALSEPMPAPFTPTAAPTRTPIIVRGGKPELKPCGKICGFEAVTADQTWSDPNAIGALEVKALCPDGKVPLGGGVFLSGEVNNVRVTGNSPWSEDNYPPAKGWIGVAILDGDPSQHQAFTLSVWANCANVE